MSADLRLGHWQDVMADVERCDVLLTDPPYSARTHNGQRSNPNTVGRAHHESEIAYAALDGKDIRSFVRQWGPVTHRWAFIFGDDLSFQAWREAWAEAGWYTFAPVVWLKKDAAPRFVGDGPQSSCEYVMVARPPKIPPDRRSRPGHYIVTTPREGTGVIGTKDVEGLVRVVLDYTRPGDLVVDPFAGTATVAAACLRQGRRYIGSEMDPDTHAKGLDRIEATRQDPVVRDRWGQPRRQKDLFG